MPTLTINGKSVTVGDEFLSLTPEQQDETVDEIAASMGGAAPQPDTGEDVFRSGATGVRQGLEGMAGMAGDINARNAKLVAKGVEWLGTSPETASMIGDATKWFNPATAFTAMMPTTEEIQQKITTPVVGEHYQPQTTAGKYARTVGEFAPSAVAGPGGIVRKAAMSVIPGVTSEAAGQATEGTGYEEAARLAGAIVGGGVAGARRMPKGDAPKLSTVADWKANADDAFERMRQEKVIFTKPALDDLETKLNTFLTKRAYWHENQPGIKGGLAMIEDIKSRGGNMTPEGLMALRKRFSGGYVMGNKENNAMVREAVNLIDDMLKNPKKGFVAAEGDAQKAALAYRDGMVASRNQHKLEDVEYLINKGQRQGDRNIIDNANKRVKTLLSDKLLDERSPMSRGWNADEKAAIKKASSWTTGERLAHAASGAMPQGKLSGAAQTAGLLYTVPAALAGNPLPLMVQGAGAGAGWGAGKLADHLARKSIRELTNLIANGGIPQQVSEEMMKRLSAKKRDALMKTIAAIGLSANAARPSPSQWMTPAGGVVQGGYQPQ